MKTAEVTLRGRTFTYSIPAMGAGYEGQVSSDGGSIVGMWDHKLPLVFVRSTTDTAWELPEPLKPLKPMTEADPTFEVATIKPSSPDKPGKYFRVVGRKYITHGTSLLDLVQVAYGLHPKQILGAPAWAREEKYDLLGIPNAEGEPNGRQWLLMMQKLLAERFQLTFHRDKQELSSYVLSVEKGGTKNLVSSESSNPLPGLEFRPAPGGLLLPARNATMAQFAQMMQQRVVDRPMVDHTGLTGKFDFQLTFLPNESQFDGHPPVTTSEGEANPAPDLVEALRQQLGLKLRAEKVLTDVLVIDRVERPSPN